MMGVGSNAHMAGGQVVTNNSLMNGSPMSAMPMNGMMNMAGMGGNNCGLGPMGQPNNGMQNPNMSALSSMANHQIVGGGVGGGVGGPMANSLGGGGGGGGVAMGVGVGNGGGVGNGVVVGGGGGGDGGGVRACAGCGGKILERFLFHALDRFWHHGCLKCSCCGARLADIGVSCYTKAGMILCRADYVR